MTQAEILEQFTALGGAGAEKVAEIGFLPFLAVLGLSLVCSLIASFLYVHFYRSRATGSELHRAFPLIGISISSIFVVIQFSLPLSLGLLGALSIVRFRTPVKEPEEIGFILLVLALSLCCATFHLLVAAVLLVVAYAALVLLSSERGFLRRSRQDGMLSITLPSPVYRERAEEILSCLNEAFRHGEVDSISTGGEEAVLSYRFTGLDGSAPPRLLQRLEQAATGARIDLFFQRRGNE